MLRKKGPARLAASSASLKRTPCSNSATPSCSSATWLGQSPFTAILPPNSPSPPARGLERRPDTPSGLTISYWRRFPAISAEGRRDWLAAAPGQSGVCSSLVWASGCDWAETLSAIGLEGFRHATCSGKVFHLFHILAANSSRTVREKCASVFSSQLSEAYNKLVSRMTT